ncbi:DNA ligase D [Actinophytocola oryzae]|uniref:DNA ligase (ATP) n=1 Tax=Actinophytocola oryzae TaxID=502181 RepID=A0A4R7VMT4_9PSEU|nr:DNA ligase D [Actinophytocola oryzae]TDV50943.1 bifunctional non-homologous end joining protein LigD [Actinophytocola oryzae]
MAGLDEYRRKRDPERTPEPVPAEGPLPTGNNDTFVIQEHHATALHWDVRLERDGVLVSWAVPRGLPDVPGDIRLAVHTEDHPMEYLDFSGEIPKGEYGGGRMFIWDRGRYETVKWSDREVAVVFNGSRARGKYTFFRSGRREKDWMVRRSEPPVKQDFSPLPELVEPMLASPGTLPEDDGDWSYEFKWDGVRALARIEGGRLRLHSRKGNDITVTYPELRLLGEDLGSTQVWLDGEIVALSDGRPSFPALQQRMHVHNDRQARSLANSVPVTYLVFDVLHLDGRSCVDLPYTERRALLEGLELNGPHWRVSPSFEGDGAAVVETAGEQQLEGVIAKRRDSRYYPGRRTADWVKITEVLTIEVLIGGWRPGEGRRTGSIGSLMMGVPTDAGVRYVGQVGTGFTDEALAALHRRLKPLVQKENPFANEVPRERAKGATWVNPELVGEVEFRNWTPDGRLRAPSWRGLRSDKDAADLDREAAPAAEPVVVEEEPDEPLPTNVLVEVEGRRIRLTNLDKVLYPETGFTKAQVIDYYSRVAPFLLPHLKDRPVTLRRFPDGVTGQPFYEKNASRNAPEWIHTVRIETPGSTRGNETLDFVLLNDLPSLVWAAHMAALELHIPQWKVDRGGERLTPDLLVFDLDPGAPATVVECCEVALKLREVLASHGLKAVAKTSGSKGMQLYAPIRTTAVERTSAYAKAVAEHLAQENPKLIVARMAKDLRPGKIFIDWSQNNQYKTTVAPYSLRGRPAPTASAPVTWDEVAACRHPNDMTFTADDVLARLDTHADLLRPLLVKKRPLLPEL